MARSIPWERRKRLLKLIPPVRCTAKSKRSGTHCQQMAMIGQNVCKWHGGKSPQAQDRAQQRIALAEASLDFDSVEPRNPWEVLAHTLHIADMMLRRILVKGAEGHWSPKEIEALTQAVERACRLAKINLDANVAERGIAFKERQAAQIEAMFLRILNGINPTPAQRALIPTLVEREIGPLLPKQIEAA